jgi:CubicO group peptidase (beta-lactamase class C family)
VSRRKVLASFAAAAAYSRAWSNFASAQPVPNSDATEDGAGPTFAAGGPDAKLYGADEDYPVPGVLRARWGGNPWEPRYRVGAFSHLDDLHRTRQIKRAASPWMFKRAAADIRYRFHGRPSSLADYLSRNPVTGLLIAKDDHILFEHYQYGRTDRNRFVSQSMVKSITGMLIGIAVSEGAIKAADDTPENYVPGFKGTEYGRTPIRDLLHMSSGIDFGEQREGGTRSQSPVARPRHRRLDLQEGHGRHYHAIRSSDRAAGDEILLRQHRAGRARRRASLRDRQISIRISAGQGVAADRRGSGRHLASGRGRN